LELCNEIKQLERQVQKSSQKLTSLQQQVKQKKIKEKKEIDQRRRRKKYNQGLDRTINILHNELQDKPLISSHTNSFNLKSLLQQVENEDSQYVEYTRLGQTDFTSDSDIDDDGLISSSEEESSFSSSSPFNSSFIDNCALETNNNSLITIENLKNNIGKQKEELQYKKQKLKEFDESCTSVTISITNSTSPHIIKTNKQKKRKRKKRSKHQLVSTGKCLIPGISGIKSRNLDELRIMIPGLDTFW